MGKGISKESHRNIPATRNVMNRALIIIRALDKLFLNRRFFIKMLIQIQN